MTPANFLNKRLQTLIVIVFLGTSFIGALLLLMGQMADSSVTSSTAHSDTAQPLEQRTKHQQVIIPEVENPDEIIATVNNTVITRQVWQQATRLDAAMSNLAHHPIPTAEKTLDRLVNEIIVLNNTSPQSIPSDKAVEARISSLAEIWDVTDDTIVATLQDVGLTRADLVERVSRLIQVETALNQLSAQESDLNSWLSQTRAAAEIGLYRSLVDAAAVQDPSEQINSTDNEELITNSLEPADEQPQVFEPPAGMPIAPYVENAAPDFTLNQLNNEPLTLSQFRGKPTIINFWATWCPPCRQELPALQAAYDAHSDQIGFVAVDVKESADTVQAFVDELGLTFPVVVDADGAVSNVSYQVRGLPTTLFIDANGVVVARHVGPLDESTIDSYLSPLLETSPSVATVKEVSSDQEFVITAPSVGTKSETQPETELPASTLLAEDQSSVQSQSSNSMSMGNSPQNGASATQPGTFATAPNFILNSADGEAIALQDYLNKSNVILVFYRGHT